MTRMRLLALALSLTLAPALAAETEDTPVTRKIGEAQTAMNAGNKAEAFRLLGEATVMDDNGQMAHKLGHLYEGSSDVPDHDALATKWFRFGADHDDAESKHHLAMRYIEGKGGLSRDLTKGISLMNASAKGGYRDARFYMMDWNKEQDTKARCMLSTLRGYGMREVVFGADRFYDFSDTGDDTGGGDTYEILGLPDNTGIELGDPDAAALKVDGFSHVGYTESQGVHFYHSYYDARRPSSAAVQRAAAVRAKCGVAER